MNPSASGTGTDSEPAGAPQEPAQAAHGKARKPIRLLLPLVLLGLGGIALWRFWPTPDTGALTLSGRIEGYPTDIDAKVSGRIDAVLVREGERVEQGQVIAQLDEAELQAQLQGAQARLTAAQQREQQARLQLSVVQSQIQEANLVQQQATGDSEGRVSQSEANLATAEANLAQAQAQLNQAQAELALTRSDRDRFAALRADGAISQQQFDQAQTAFETAQATVNSRQAAVAATQRQVNAAEGALTQARSQTLNPAIRSAQIDTLRQQLEVANAQLTTAQAEVANAQAAVQEAEARLDNLTLVSPIDGVVLTRSVEPGTVVSPGTTLLTVINPESVYLRGFIPEGEIGRVRLGQPAQVYLDSFPQAPLAAEVRSIDAEASFTPENIYFKEDRVRQVFGVELAIENPEGFAKPGMPADGEILVEGEPGAAASVDQ